MWSFIEGAIYLGNLGGISARLVHDAANEEGHVRQQLGLGVFRRKLRSHAFVERHQTPAALVVTVRLADRRTSCTEMGGRGALNGPDPMPTWELLRYELLRSRAGVTIGERGDAWESISTVRGLRGVPAGKLLG